MKVLVLLGVLAALGGSRCAFAQSKVTLKEAQPGLSTQAKVRVADAEKTALRATPGVITRERIEKLGAQLVYVFSVRLNKANSHVLVDAQSGQIVTPRAKAVSKTAARARSKTSSQASR